MSVYDLNFQGNVNDNLPPNKRTVGMLAYLFSLIWPLQWRHDINFGSYWLGSTDPAYLINTAYTKGQRVIYLIQGNGTYYGDNAVYEANKNVPMNIPPIQANQVDQNGNGYWIKVQDNFIGSSERQTYSCLEIILEFALNRWFHSAFRQRSANSYPAWPIPGGDTPSDIFIVTNQNNQAQMWASPTSIGLGSAGMARTALLALFGCPPTPQPVNVNDFTIYIPVAIYNALSATAGLRDGIVRAFVDKYNCVGNKYNIVTY